MAAWTLEASRRAQATAKLMGLTQEMLVERAGIPISTLQRILTGKVASIEGDRLRSLARALDTSPEYLLQGEDVATHDEVETVPLYDVEVAAGRGRFSLDNEAPISAWPFPRDWLAQHFGAGAQLALLRVVGDSQEPELYDGDSVMIDRRHNRPRDGMHVIRLGDVLVIKRIQLEGNRIRLRSANPSYSDVELDPAIDVIDVIGRAVWAGKLL